MPQYYQRKAMGRATRAQLPLLLLATMCALRNSVALAGGSGNGSGTAGINTGIRTYTSKNNVLVSGGLVNLGNTCYLNAQLQCAYHVPLVRELILNGPPPKPAPPKPAPVSPANPQTDEDDAITEAEDVAKDDNEEKTEITEEEEEEEDKIEPIPKEEPASIGLLSLRHVFSLMKSGSYSLSSSALGVKGLPASTFILCRNLGISVLEQQDSQEFWKLLLPELKLPILADIYSGSYEDYISAQDGSGRERRREETFLDISLEVSSGSVIHSMEEQFKKPELLSEKEGNGWRPEKGADKVDALKGSLLRAQGLPSLLQLHLKRFRYDWQTDVMSKINDKFEFPEELDLSEVCTDVEKEEEERTIYDLQSIVVHVGEFGSGHYYAYVRPDIRSDRWYRFDDDKVTPVDFKDVIADSYGGRARRAKKRRAQKQEEQKKKRFFGRLFRGIGGGGGGQPFGWGGRTSSAYMLQYVRRCDISLLYGEGQTKHQ